jgi:type I restriction enzyme S subunit
MNFEKLPEGWQIKNLSNCLESLESGGRPKGGASLNGEMPSIGAEHLNNRGSFNFESMKFIPIEYYNGMSRGKIKKEDILIVKDGATTGKTSFVDSKFPYNEAAVNEHVFIVRTDSAILNARFAFYFLYSDFGKKQILKDFRGSAQGGITTGFVSKVKLPLPPLAVQQQIAAILEKADAAREKRRQANQLTEQFLQSAFLEMFDARKHRIVKLQDVCTRITDGTHKTPNYIESGVPFVSVKDVRGGRLSFEDVKYISREEHQLMTKRWRPERNDILYTKVGATFGNATLINVDTEFSIFVSLALLKPNFRLINPIFLTCMMNSEFIKRQARRRVRGIAVPDLHLVEIKDFDVFLPDISEQQKFAALVEKVESLRAKQRQSEQELEHLLNSLMQRALRGELS